MKSICRSTTTRALALLACALLSPPPSQATPLNCGILRIHPLNGWKAFEVITVGDDPVADGETYAMPGVFDGIGAQVVGETLRLQINHETSDASISEVILRTGDLQDAIANVISTGGTGGVTFVASARQAYGRWSSSAGSSWTSTSSVSNTAFARFCSGQSHRPDMFGVDHGFVDEIYITGEEVDNGRLFALELATRDLYQLSGVTGSGPGGIGGMPFDSFENAALLDTGETGHIALLLSPDGDTNTMRLYVGEKGKDVNGNSSTSFLARNGLAYGSSYFLNDSLPAVVGSTSTDGFFDTTIADALTSTKLEDIDTDPMDGTRVVLGDQTSGVFVFDFDLTFSGAGFDAGASGFSVTLIQGLMPSGSDSFDNPDNVDWTEGTELGGVAFADGLIFLNEDSGEGEIWMMRPDGSDRVLIASTTDVTESSGILDISTLIGFMPGSVLLTSSQGGNSSLTVMIHPDAASSSPPRLVDSCAGNGGDQQGCTDCPCVNNAPSGALGGCLNSAGSSARLLASGSPSVTGDTLRFEVTGANGLTFGVLASADNLLPNAGACPPGSGLQSVGVLDGLRCIGGALLRHGSRATDANGDIGVTNNGWGSPSGPAGGLIAQGGFTAGQTRNFQCFYRELGSLVCMTGQNTTQAVSATFLP